MPFLELCPRHFSLLAAQILGWPALQGTEPQQMSAFTPSQRLLLPLIQKYPPGNGRRCRTQGITHRPISTAVLLDWSTKGRGGISNRTQKRLKHAMKHHTTPTAQQQKANTETCEHNELIPSYFPFYKNHYKAGLQNPKQQDYNALVIWNWS